MNPKYTVVIITYNQENLINRAINSVLCQKELVFEIIVSDDCSTDSTWEVIRNYHKKYPELIKPFQNQVNLGILGHIENTWTRVSGDVIFYLSGDDILCEGLFEKANDLINKHKIDFKNELFTLYFDFKAVTPNEEEIVFSNSMIIKYNPISLKLRNLISNRTTGVSKTVLDKYFPINKEIGNYADGLIDIQTQLFSKRNYYSAFIGSVYYTNIGIASRATTIELYRSYILCVDEFLTILKGLKNDDINWLNYQKSKYTFALNPTYSNFFKYLSYLLRNINFKYGFKFVKREIKQFLSLFVNSLHLKNTIILFY